MRFLLPALFLGGCTPSGIYMITLPYVEGGSECPVSIEENFTDGFVDDEDGGGSSEWTETSTYTGADSIMFVHISPTSGGGAVLTMGDSVFPGEADGDGWTFTWSEHTTSSDTSEHEDGYSFTYATDNVTTATIHVAQPMFADLSGTMSIASTDIEEWSEKDKWDPEDNGIYDAQIPSTTYLVYKDSGDLYPQPNLYDEKDCKDSLCSIKITTDCPGDERSFTADQVTGEDVLLYNDIMNDGQ